MGVAVIFGLAFATVLTLVMVPVMISLIWRFTGAPEIETPDGDDLRVLPSPVSVQT